MQATTRRIQVRNAAPQPTPGAAVRLAGAAVAAVLGTLSLLAVDQGLASAHADALAARPARVHAVLPRVEVTMTRATASHGAQWVAQAAQAAPAR